MGTTSSEPARDPIEQAGRTGRLALANAQLEAVPARVWLVGDRLRSLDLSNNKLLELPSQVGTLCRLQTLVLSNNGLRHLPEELYCLEELRILAVDGNRLVSATFLPRKRLKQLDLSNNQFAGVVGHPALALPPSLTSCKLSGNPITGFDSSFGFQVLTLLEELDLDGCQITALPDDCGHMESLRCMKLRNNRLQTLPSALFTGTRLNRIHLDGNPVSLKHLSTVAGWEDFLGRRKERLDKSISQGVRVDVTICGLEEEREALAT
mmetsp:Transcript_11193/g.31757  ORF Transcript_11193/g.31757 Transcript_11193/m.31757 type:complete len:265 (-) Transcript_11193:889-1683(-)|eukprot:CAMPEP_0202081940 /NCGR_PEP_ID=MMETSP0964-20121228/17101_1 /ASSEMBLY_ACC=CAM_ASM_000500 /TAXON_ID=4773 /ORGANISM="Schizochytrium aggregatum, Strain ATCC28209" /LENGTH=264 /DNA_ID=CAMNT_0048649541 /DNA_START=75 /DNA_END=869 /DNA_ORIENTATION=+